MIDYSDAGERVVPLHKDWNFFSHLSVYRLAATYISGRVLDAGCGTGYGTVYLLDRGATHVTGIDRSELAIAFCNDHFKADRLDFRIVNMEKPLPFTDRCFDSIFSSNSIEHVAKVDDLLSELARTLKPDGTIFIAVPAITTPKALADNIANPHHMTNLSPICWHAKIHRRFGCLRSFAHWPSPGFAGWDQIREAFPTTPERTTIRETDFNLQEHAIVELNVLEDNLNAVFIGTDPRTR